MNRVDLHLPAAHKNTARESEIPPVKNARLRTALLLLGLIAGAGYQAKTALDLGEQERKEKLAKIPRSSNRSQAAPPAEILYEAKK